MLGYDNCIYLSRWKCIEFVHNMRLGVGLPYTDYIQNFNACLKLCNIGTQVKNQTELGFVQKIIEKKAKLKIFTESESK